MALVFHIDGETSRRRDVLTCRRHQVKHWLDPEPAQPDPLREWWCWLDRDSDWPEDTESQ